MLAGGEDISKIVSALGGILRYSINTSIKFVTLKEDLDQIKNYLYIQKVRYEDKFNIFFHIDPATMICKINKLLIQPLVENAIQHGLEYRETGGVLCISSKIKEEALLIEVFDNGIGISEERIFDILESEHNSETDDKKTHIGIRNVHERIQLYYGRQYGVEIKSRIGKYTKVILKLPIAEVRQKI